MMILDVMRTQALALSMTASHMPHPQPSIDRGNSPYDDKPEKQRQ